MSSHEGETQDQTITSLLEELKTLKSLTTSLSTRLNTLESTNAIRQLHHKYGYYIDICAYDQLPQLFSADCTVVFLSGIYRGHAGVRRLYQQWFGQFFTQGKTGPVYGFLLDHFMAQDIITVAADGKSAKGRFRTLLMGGCHESRPYKPEGLPSQFFEAGIYENDYVLEDEVDGEGRNMGTEKWKIKKLDYVVQWQADYEAGWANTKAHLKPLVVTYPENPLGPDELLPEEERRETWPERKNVDMHYASM